MVGIQKWGAEIIDTSCRWSVKSMPHPPPSFLLPSSCASDRLCVGVHERKRRRREREIERDGKKSSYLCKSWHERRYSAESLSMIKALLNQSKLTFNPFINPIINYHLNAYTDTRFSTSFVFTTRHYFFIFHPFKWKAKVWPENICIFTQV